MRLIRPQVPRGDDDDGRRDCGLPGAIDLIKPRLCDAAIMQRIDALVLLAPPIVRQAGPSAFAPLEMARQFAFRQRPERKPFSPVSMSSGCERPRARCDAARAHGEEVAHPVRFLRERPLHRPRRLLPPTVSLRPDGDSVEVSRQWGRVG